jgi:hypothetical protein
MNCTLAASLLWCPGADDPFKVRTPLGAVIDVTLNGISSGRLPGDGHSAFNRHLDEAFRSLGFDAHPETWGSFVSDRIRHLRFDGIYIGSFGVDRILSIVEGHEGHHGDPGSDAFAVDLAKLDAFLADGTDLIQRHPELRLTQVIYSAWSAARPRRAEFLARYVRLSMEEAIRSQRSTGCAYQLQFVGCPHQQLAQVYYKAMSDRGYNFVPVCLAWEAMCVCQAAARTSGEVPLSLRALVADWTPAVQAAPPPADAPAPLMVGRLSIDHNHQLFPALRGAIATAGSAGHEAFSLWGTAWARLFEVAAEVVCLVNEGQKHRNGFSEVAGAICAWTGSDPMHQAAVREQIRKAARQKPSPQTLGLGPPSEDGGAVPGGNGGSSAGPEIGQDRVEAVADLPAPLDDSDDEGVVSDGARDVNDGSSGGLPSPVHRATTEAVESSGEGTLPDAPPAPEAEGAVAMPRWTLAEIDELVNVITRSRPRHPQAKRGTFLSGLQKE